MPAPLALYIHWPFCKSKCPYCDFNSHVRDRVDLEAFKTAMITELNVMAARVQGRELISIFFGGGTPSLMPPDIAEALIARAKQLFLVSPNIEITLEANPTSVEADKFKAFHEAGVNRVSLGVQSLNKNSLKFLGRQHSADEALKAVELAAHIFPRYSFDMIYALPNQTVGDWEKELKMALTYTRGHMSLYQLTIEENTAFYHEYHQKKSFEIPIDDKAAEFYEITQDIMEAHSLPAYEISNHAATGQESKHNLAYWLGYEYLGIGAGAHGRIRHTNTDYEKESIWFATSTIKSPERWLEAVSSKGTSLEQDVTLTARERLEERIMMRLRLRSAVERSMFPLENARELLELLARERLIELSPTHFKLTRKGSLVQQAIVSELISAI